jgi:hypothetical protein
MMPTQVQKCNVHQSQAPDILCPFARMKISTNFTIADLKRFKVFGIYFLVFDSQFCFPSSDFQSTSSLSCFVCFTLKISRCEKKNSIKLLANCKWQPTGRKKNLFMINITEKRSDEVIIYGFFIRRR